MNQQNQLVYDQWGRLVPAASLVGAPGAMQPLGAPSITPSIAPGPAMVGQPAPGAMQTQPAPAAMGATMQAPQPVQMVGPQPAQMVGPQPAQMVGPPAATPLVTDNFSRAVQPPAPRPIFGQAVPNTIDPNAPSAPAQPAPASAQPAVTPPVDAAPAGESPMYPPSVQARLDLLRQQQTPRPQQSPQQAQSDDPYAGITRDLLGRESSGRYGVVNRQGYSGGYQFGTARLNELGFYTPGQGESLKRNGWGGSFAIPGFEGVKTQQDFLRNPAAQDYVFRQHIANIDQAIDALPNSENFDRDGLRRVAHLGGVEGMRKFVAGGYNPNDANGTKLSDYYYGRNRGGRAGSSGSGVPAASGNGSTPPMNEVSVPDRPRDFNEGGDAPQRAGAASGREPGIPEYDPKAPNRTWGLTSGDWFRLGAGIMSGDGYKGSFQNAGVVLGQAADGNDREKTGIAQAKYDAALKRYQVGQQDRQLDIADRRAAAEEARYTQTARGNRWTTLTIMQDEGGEQFAVERDNTNGTIRRTPLGGVRAQDANRNKPFETVEAKSDGDVQTGLYAAASSGQATLRTTARLREELAATPEFEGGTLWDRGARTLAQTFGFSLPNNATAGDIEQIGRRMRESTAEDLRSAAAALKPLSDSDMKWLQANYPTVETTRAGWMKFLDELEQRSSRAVAKGDAFREFVSSDGRSRYAGRGGYATWSSAYDADRRERPPAAAAPAASAPQATPQNPTGASAPAPSTPPIIRGRGFTYTP